jgi:hypothetical protein
MSTHDKHRPLPRGAKLPASIIHPTFVVLADGVILVGGEEVVARFPDAEAWRVSDGVLVAVGR